MKEVRNFHNNLFIKTFSDIANVKDFISGALPSEIIENIAPGSAYVEPTSFVEDSLSSHLSDLVIKLKANDGKRNFDLYLLFEHKSYVDEKILWQLLKYQYLMFEEDHNTKRKFRTIIPVVFYHGRGKWKVPMSFSESINMPEYLKKYAMNFEYILFDTKDFDLTNEDRFGKNSYLMSVLSLLKDYGRMNPEKLETIFRYFKRSGLVKEHENLIILMRYIYFTNQVEEKELVNIMKAELGEEAEEIMPSLGKKILQEGALQKAVETCKVALSKGFDLQTVIQLTGLPIEKVLEIQKSLKIN
jgi:predicted transposase/invertase (TIGR01784 family)